MRFPGSFREIHQPRGGIPIWSDQAKFQNFIFEQKYFFIFWSFSTQKNFFLSSKCVLHFLTRSENAISGLFLWNPPTWREVPPFEVTKHKINENQEIFHNFPEPIFSLIERIFWRQDCYSIITWSENFFSEVSGAFWYNFEILTLQNFLKSEIFKFCLVTSKGGTSPRLVDFTKRVRKSHFQIE